MPSKRARGLALDMADAHLERTGITKAAGGLQREDLAARFLPTAVAVAELIGVVKRAMKRNQRLLEENGRRVAALAERSGVPGVTSIHQGMVSLDLERFGVTLAERQLAGDGPQDFYPGHSVDPVNDGN